MYPKTMPGDLLWTKVLGCCHLVEPMFCNHQNDRVKVANQHDQFESDSECFCDQS